MAHYSPEFLAAVRHRYEKTDQPMIEMAREFGIGITTLQVMVDKQGWEKRSQRLRGLPRAVRLEREAEALAAGGLSSPPPERGRSDAGACAASGGGRVGVNGTTEQIESRQTTPTFPLSRGGREAAPLAAPAGGGEPAALAAEQTPVARLEALVVREIADLESARDLRGGKRVSGAGAERTAQALASLTRTLQTIRAMRGESVPDDDEIEDIDAFRLRLAKKIEDFFERRGDEDFGEEAVANGDVQQDP